MIYLLHGENKEAAGKKAREIIDGLIQRKPDAAFFKINEDNWSEAAMDEYVSGMGLFSAKYIVLLDSLLGNREIKDIIVSKVKKINESENVFVILDGALDKTTLSKLSKNSHKVQEFQSRVAKKKNTAFNIFTLSDALGRRDKKTLWVLFTRAKKEGFEDEQIHGTLFWAIKNMIVASSSANAKDAGMNPFVFSKAKDFVINYSPLELKRTAKKLVVIYHESRRGKRDLRSAIERFILEI
ncbi:MAG: hypothetical protein A3G52_01725 [Candidatus Taylorbacteria bacterium RIFCSPLOWO2_12_FULL_43_20]|uniref:DNA polymerase III delta N-terminal domain-containing protein n=1 Tax=Candidatus Taylorbacteria bacterium RIFCSPLOWO2_12_FULL_43_20 TaxID=1802332 RepID=A0A1G2P0W7_9BACT|nr:MAG: hypothetical protein A3B98_00210 [Candidatus Taylorbacteria bacterium RIFCSPHIGHO2_02_FULL_43_55]OHA29923.1 MAG: hypothetical protein A3E92_03840 [Candidatus Taylorbacteria bacterium RIFCSPHIGHO2_12_FULL_42_34]OHA30556.1 MAG: hypothetical protein A3B09_01465 [Candidatus Taylorbacteria bacterium RIFCSPLOWO2_01_FULL_43_83]OHA38387.1 MAG: hypothetical protein A3H58_04265 [Candidatus Taylorbacteria bacterium RIFCSPLOWO2_02_FULL_43_22b]OHA41995.1 MAG: hypothetical protein A3G52_01725 [Candid